MTTRSEQRFQLALERALNAPGRATRVWRQQAGRLRTRDGWVRLGPPGCADLTGEVAPWGTRLEVEAKSATGRQTAEQLRWQMRCRLAGSIYVCVYDDAEETLSDSVALAVGLVDAAIAGRLGL